MTADLSIWRKYKCSSRAPPRRTSRSPFFKTPIAKTLPTKSGKSPDNENSHPSSLGINSNPARQIPSSRTAIAFSADGDAKTVRAAGRLKSRKPNLRILPHVSKRRQFGFWRILRTLRQRMRDGNSQNHGFEKRFNTKNIAWNRPRIETHRRSQRRSSRAALAVGDSQNDTREFF